jgi:hypothetical protein
MINFYSSAALKSWMSFISSGYNNAVVVSLTEFTRLIRSLIVLRPTDREFGYRARSGFYK